MAQNYFNYFTEIEDTFIRRRGKHLLLSPMDWALIESWKETGVPLHVALRGIEQSFDSYEAQPRRRSVKSLFYCQEEVEAQYAEWLEAQVGASPAGSDREQARVEGNGDGAKIEEDARLPFPRDVILAHLDACRQTLVSVRDARCQTGADELCEALTRALVRLEELETDFAQAARPDAEQLDGALTDLERLLDRALLARLSPDAHAARQTAAEQQLEPYRRRMDRATYEQTRDNLLAKILRDECNVPRLSLFYL